MGAIQQQQPPTSVPAATQDPTLATVVTTHHTYHGPQVLVSFVKKTELLDRLRVVVAPKIFLNKEDTLGTYTFRSFTKRLLNIAKV